MSSTTLNPTGKPVPKPTPETAPYWEGCAAEELRLQHCANCGHVQFYPRKLCSACFSENVVWRKASGRGTIRSWSTVVAPGAPGFQEEVPFISILVQLEEGPTMLSVIRQCEAEDMAFDMPVEVIFEQRSDTIFVPYFKPAS
ncbi:MAG: OB-fold domain-containing protein [Pseudomonadota bacterium]